MPPTEAVRSTRSAAELGLSESSTLSPRVEQACAGVWVVHDVLTRAECEGIVKAGDALGLRQNGTGRFRDCTRAIFLAPDASALVFSRLKHLPLFADQLAVLPSDKTIHQPPLQGVAGVWQPYGINECWRLCHYTPGGHFAPHYDDGAHPHAPLCRGTHGPNHSCLLRSNALHTKSLSTARCGATCSGPFRAEFEHGTGDRSLRTFMLYLNDVPKSAGGATNIVSGSSSAQWCAAEGRFVRAEGSEVDGAVQPRAGSAIVFNHRILHEGERLTEGTKWILRTEVMFKQTRQEPPLHLSVAELEGQRLFEEGQSLEGTAAKLDGSQSAEKGRLLAGAGALYSRVCKLAPRVAQANGL